MGECLTPSYDDEMLWSAMTLTHFACMHVAEFAVWDPAHPEAKWLLNQDLTFDSLPDGTCYAQLFLREMKTDKTGAGVKLYIGCWSEVCAVCGLKKYCCRWDMRLPLPLFQYEIGEHLSRKKFVEMVKSIISQLDLEVNSYSGHSFRSGSTTTAGLSVWEIKLLCCWHSQAYLRYIRIPLNEIAGFASRMARVEWTWALPSAGLYYSPLRSLNWILTVIEWTYFIDCVNKRGHPVICRWQSRWRSHMV